MTDLVITAASVVKGANAVTTIGVLGATATQGQVGYLDTATNTWKLADNDGVAAAKNPSGIFLTSGATGQPCVVLTKGDLTLGATIVAGVAYYLSATPGGICAVADLSAGHDSIVLGVAKSTTVLAVDIQDPGVTL